MKRVWQDFYLFMFRVKMIAGIYYLAFVFFYFALNLVRPELTISLSLSRALEFFAAAMLIGLGSGFLLPNKEWSMIRMVLWAIWALIITVTFTEAYGWFNMYPGWYRFVVYSFMTISFFFYWLALEWRLERETKVLNDALERFKETSIQ